MKIHLALFALVSFSCAGMELAPAQILTGFGTAQFNPFDTSNDFLPGWPASSATLTATTLTVTNVSNSSGGIYAVLPTPVDITGSTALLQLTGSLLQAPVANHFQLTLYDSSLNSLVYNFNWSSFNSSTTSVTSALDVVGSTGIFDGIVGSWALNLGGTPGDTLSFSFEDLTSVPFVPEPSTYILLVLGLFAIILRFQRGQQFLKPYGVTSGKVLS